MSSQKYQMCLFVNVILFSVMLFAFENARAASQADRSAFRCLYSFGDSSVDPGNNNYIMTKARSNFPPYGNNFPGKVATGRFSNGLLFTDYLAYYLGCPKYQRSYLGREFDYRDPVTAISFASAASGYDPDTAHKTEKMEAMRDEAIQCGTPLSNEELSRICLGEATTKNYIRGFGKGPKPSTYFSKSKSLLAHQDQLQKVQYELNLIREERQREREEEKTRREEEQKQREEEQRRREEEWEEEKRRWERQRDEEREEEKRRWDEEQRRREEEQRQERAAFLKEFDTIKNYFRRSEAQW